MNLKKKWVKYSTSQGCKRLDSFFVEEDEESVIEEEKNDK